MLRMRIVYSILLPWVVCGASAVAEGLRDAHHGHSGLNGPSSERTHANNNWPGGSACATTVTLSKSGEISPKHETLRNFLGQEPIDPTGQNDKATVDLIGASFIAHVTVGTQIVPLLVDTGSSDLWVVPSNFVCLDQNGTEVHQSTCGFPSFYEGPFSGGVVPDEYFSILYGNGQFVYGPYGFESVSLGGITVPDQQVALPAKGYIQVSSGDYSGLLGLAYPAMVPARKGKEPRLSANNTDAFAEHDTWFFNAVKKNLTKPLFSMALDIDGGGLLAIGGVMDVPIQGDFASTPILIVSHSPLQSIEIPGGWNVAKESGPQMNLVNETRAETQFTYYTIIADDYLINGQSVSRLSATAANIPASPGFPVIVDSGYSTNVLPPSLVTLFYEAFDDTPQPVDIHGGTMFAAPCDAGVPNFGVQVGGQVFEMTKEATLVSRLNTTVNGTLVCGLGIQPGIEEAGALGDTFLSSVVAVFDVGASEMRFAQRGSSRFTGGEEAPSADGGRAKDEL